jgi:ribose transport system ATP-binding protein/rhamnose transport system ATP-binding protein
MAFIELRGVSKQFGGVRALRGVDVAFEQGRVHALLGENGAGKSTLIKTLAGAVQPDSGEITIAGQRAQLSPRSSKQLGIAVVYQEPMIYPHLSVLENIFMGQELVSPGGFLRRGEMATRATPTLTRLGLDPSILEQPMGALSIGYQQLVLIVQALIQGARALIFDEPTSILSKEETDRLLGILRGLRESGHAVIYITHRIEEVYQIADEVTVLTDGAVVGHFPIAEIGSEQLLALMSGASKRDYQKRSSQGRVTGAPILAAEHLCVPPYAQDLSWQIYAGELTCVYGLVGSGRSESFQAVFGHLRPASGRILLGGQPVAPRSPAHAIRLGIGYLPEDRKLQGIFADKNLEFNQTASVLRAFLQWLGKLDLRGLVRATDQGMREYGVKAKHPGVQIALLSGGNQQKILFTRWAKSKLKVLILDEPTRGIDVGTKAEIHEFIRRLVDSGVGVVVITSDLEEALQIGDRILVMRKGRIVEDLRGEALNPETILSAAIGARS